MVEPAILKAVQGVEQRHVEEANHLSNGIDGEEANNHSLRPSEYTMRFYSTRERHVCIIITLALT